MLLIITNRDDAHADYVIPEIQNRGELVYRLNTEDLSTSVKMSLFLGNQNRGILELPVGTIDTFDIKGVWYRRPKRLELSLEISDKQYHNFAVAESHEALTGLYHLLDCLWVSRPESISSASNKIKQLKVAKSFGLRTPRTIVTNNSAEALAFYSECRNGLIVKSLTQTPIVDARGIEQFVYTHLVDSSDLDYIDAVDFCPTLLQEYIPKDLELRITIIGNKVFAIAIHSQENETTMIDWRLGITSHQLRYTVYDLPDTILQACIGLTQAFNLAFSAIDMIKTPEGEYVFLEINPNGQWAWIELETGLPMRKALIDLLLGV